MCERCLTGGITSSLTFIQLYFFKKAPTEDNRKTWNLNKTFKVDNGREAVQDKQRQRHAMMQKTPAIPQAQCPLQELQVVAQMQLATQLTCESHS